MRSDVDDDVAGKNDDDVGGEDNDKYDRNCVDTVGEFEEKDNNDHNGSDYFMTDAMIS